MQVRKFEAPTIQEAIETIKRELGPEAIILQTKQNKKGFGLMSKGSVEVTAAVAEKSLVKKKHLDKKMPAYSQNTLQKLTAEKQAKIYDSYSENLLKGVATQQDRVEIAARTKLLPKGVITDGPSAPVRVTARRYIDIDERVKTEEKITVAPQTYESSVQSAPVQDAMQTQAQSASLQSEVQRLRVMIEDLRRDSGGGTQQTERMPDAAPFASLALEEAYNLLTLNGMERRLAYRLVKGAEAALSKGDPSQIQLKQNDKESVLDHTAAEIIRSTHVVSILDGIPSRKDRPELTAPQVISFIGPTGVGKTTTLAKVASQAILNRGLKVGLINLDTYKVAAVDQLATYAQILQTPFRSVSNAEELNLALKDLRNLDLILIDTTGRSQKDDESLAAAEKLLNEIPNLRSQLVLSSTTRDQELYDVGHRFARFRPEALILSKLDEASVFGAIYNVSQRLKLPISYFTTGQRVPEDIEVATEERVTALVMDLL